MGRGTHGGRETAGAGEPGARPVPGRPPGARARGLSRLRPYVLSLAAAGLLASCTVLPTAGPRGEEGTRPPSRAARPHPLPAARPQGPLGTFTVSGAEGVRRIRGLQDWLGGTEPRVGHTYLPGDSWRDIEGRPGFLAPWASWRNEESDRLFVLNVPLQEHNEAGVKDAKVRGLLRAGAKGRFDAHFRTLARRLVNLGVPDTVLVLGWEMNGSTYTHRCGPDPVSFKRYWRRIVRVMRTVPGQRFRFDFAPSRGGDRIGWPACYPGDDVVDIVGMDSYDQPAGESFHRQVHEPFGLQAQVDFAAKHHKPVSYPEWGLFRNGDDPEYVSRMLGWFRQHRPVYQTLSDYCPHGVLRCKQNPNSAETYRAALYGQPKPGTRPPQDPAEPHGSPGAGTAEPGEGAGEDAGEPGADGDAESAGGVEAEGLPWYERCLGVGDFCFRASTLGRLWGGH